MFLQNSLKRKSGKDFIKIPECWCFWEMWWSVLQEGQAGLLLQSDEHNLQVLSLIRKQSLSGLIYYLLYSNLLSFIKISKDCACNRTEEAEAVVLVYCTSAYRSLNFDFHIQGFFQNYFLNPYTSLYLCWGIHLSPGPKISPWKSMKVRK